MARKSTVPRLGIALSCFALWSAAQAQIREINVDVLADREQLLAAYQHMPRAQVERVFMRCDSASREAMMGFQDAVLCAMAWDALLKRGFGGDVQALLAWWHAQREAQAPASYADSRGD